MSSLIFSDVRNKNREIESLRQINEELKIISDSQLSRDMDLKTQELEVLKLAKDLKQEQLEFAKLKNQNNCLKISNEVLQRRLITLEKENKYLEIRLRLKEDEVDDFVTYNKPLEKAYKSLQRRYGMIVDRLEHAQHFKHA